MADDKAALAKAMDDAVDVMITRLIREEIGSGDLTTGCVVPENLVIKADLKVREEGVLSGLQIADKLIKKLDPRVQVKWLKMSGDVVKPNTVFGTMMGPAKSIMSAERAVLNLLQRMCGVASSTKSMVDALGNLPTRIHDTIKTMPFLRVLDKVAVRDGGGKNHRSGLYDMVLIQENHIKCAGSMVKAINAAKQNLSKKGKLGKVLIEVECRSLEDVNKVMTIDGGVDRILLDSMVMQNADGTTDTAMLREAISVVNGKIPIEASGNVTRRNIKSIAECGVDYISIPEITHSARYLEIDLAVTIPKPGAKL